MLRARGVIVQKVAEGTGRFPRKHGLAVAMVASVLIFFFQPTSFAESTSNGLSYSVLPTSPLSELTEALRLTGAVESNSMQYYTYGVTEWRSLNDSHLWRSELYDYSPASDSYITPVSPLLFSSFNSTYPHGINDGLLWQGRGFNASLTGGAKLHTQYLDVTISPEIAVMQNISFPTASQENRSVYSSLDVPQRFGDDPLMWLGGGHSEIRGRYGSLSVGFGTQNVTIGPSVRNPLLFSAHPGGFPHFDLGIERVSTRFGDVEARALWGRASESAYFDDDPSNDHKLITGLMMSYAFPFARNLTIGANRVVMTNWNHMKSSDWFAMFIPSLDGTNTSIGNYGEDDLDQRFSLTFEWLFPESGFRFYGEWARNDFAPSSRQLFVLIGHSQAYTLGFQHAIQAWDNGFFTLTGELSELWLSRDYFINNLGRGGTFYAHSSSTNGQTHRGQIIGAGIGSGANAQFLRVRYYDDFGYVGVFVQRHARNQDVIYNSPEHGDYNRLDTEGTLAFEGGYLLDAHLIYGRIELSRNYNRNYQYKVDAENFHAELGVQTSF